jgi:phage gp36-like protein
MAYAAPSDMVTRFGQIEMLRLTSPEGQPLDVIDIDRLNLALGDASAVMDSFLRRRYLTPVSPVPSELVRACCILARFDLAHGDGREPSKQMADADADTRKWLVKLFDGTALLPDATPAGEQSFAQAQVRGSLTGGGCPPYSDSGCGWTGSGESWS